MAIDRIPGVGPTNADIATAVAAPSAATIAAAVAAPSAATIAAAVAAPSSATIATAVAAAVPTIGAINTSVANNAPSPNAWTLIGSAGITGVNTTTFSSLSGYKAYRVMVVRASSTSGAQEVGLRINGDTGSNYAALFGTNATLSPAYFRLTFINTTSLNAFGSNGCVDINNANLASPKRIINGVNVQNSGALSGTNIIEGLWQGTATVNSITVFNATGADLFTQGTVYLLGAN